MNQTAAHLTLNRRPSAHYVTTLNGAAASSAAIVHLLTDDDGADARGDSRQRRLIAARDTLRSRYFEAITMHDLAAVACMSLHHFLRSYSAQFGRSAHEELVALRLALAERLLRETSLPVAEVATASGFETRTTLFRHFVRAHQLSPVQFRSRERRIDQLLRGGNAKLSLLGALAPG